MKRSEIDKLSLKALKITLASGLTGEDYKYALTRYLRIVREREKLPRAARAARKQEAPPLGPQPSYGA